MLLFSMSLIAGHGTCLCEQNSAVQAVIMSQPATLLLCFPFSA